MKHSQESRGVKPDKDGMHTCPMCGTKFSVLSKSQYAWKIQYHKEWWYFCKRSCYLVLRNQKDADGKRASEERKARKVEKNGRPES